MNTTGGSIVGKTHDGQVWYECPECHGKFTMSQRKDKWRTEKMRCPYCGKRESEQLFRMSPEGTLQLSSKAVEKQIVSRINKTLEDLPDNGEGMIYNKASHADPDSDSIFIKRDEQTMYLEFLDWLLRDVTCDQCKHAYRVEAIALFCPNCGASNLYLHFKCEEELIQKQIKLANQVETKGDRELAYRLLGNAYEDAVTAFETYQKTVAEVSCERAAGSVSFQNIDRSKTYWEKEGLDFSNILTNGEWSKLEKFIKKRHVITHNLSRIDQRYLKYVTSQRKDSEELNAVVNIFGAEINESVRLIAKIVQKLETILD